MSAVDREEAIPMSDKILVVYATRYGSTQEVAAAIADTLRDHQLEVSLREARDVRTLEGYDAVILGAPLYVGKWHKDAHQFLRRHESVLMRKPVAIFALGPINDDEQEILGSRVQLDTELKQYSWLKPVATEMFVGKYDPSKFHFFDRLIAHMPASPIYKLPASDHRDWVAIRTWATDLAQTLESMPVI
jgi:menaquinone-dependent protoporphyrinogen oxidase